MKKSLQDLTVKTYQDNFEKYKELTSNIVSWEEKEWIDEFCDNLTPNWTIFELWSAHWRDARYFRDKWFQVFCSDIIPQALIELQKEWFKTQKYDFRDKPEKSRINKFDWIFANWVLLHASKEEFPQIIENLLSILKDNWILAFWVKNWKGSETTERKIWKRYFQYYSLIEIQEILSANDNLQIIQNH